MSYNLIEMLFMYAFIFLLVKKLQEREFEKQMLEQAIVNRNVGLIIEVFLVFALKAMACVFVVKWMLEPNLKMKVLSSVLFMFTLVFGVIDKLMKLDERFHKLNIGVQIIIFTTLMFVRILEGSA